MTRPVLFFAMILVAAWCHACISRGQSGNFRVEPASPQISPSYWWSRRHQHCPSAGHLGERSLHKWNTCGECCPKMHELELRILQSRPYVAPVMLNSSKKR